MDGKNMWRVNRDSAVVSESVYSGGFVWSDRLFQDPFILQKDTITVDSLLLAKQNHKGNP